MKIQLSVFSTGIFLFFFSEYVILALCHFDMFVLLWRGVGVEGTDGIEGLRVREVGVGGSWLAARGRGTWPGRASGSCV